jgi:hypothetical protein
MGEIEVRGGKGIKQKKPGYQMSFKEIKIPLTYILIYFLNSSQMNILFIVNGAVEQRSDLLNVNVLTYLTNNGNNCYFSPIYCFGLSGLVPPSI